MTYQNTQNTVDPATFRLLMLSAMYENGGNTTHRLLDGHPELAVYPFESQIGTRLVSDHLTSLYPIKYRWPEFRLSASSADDYEAIIDEETRVRARTPHVSKFRNADFDFSDDERREEYLSLLEATPRSRATNVAAFFVATFRAWRNYHGSERESVYVGYSPIVAVDAEKVLVDLPAAHVLHVVRNPWSAYADTKKRPVPLSLPHYMTGWITVQYFALIARARFPERMHIRRYEDIVEQPEAVLGDVCARIGVRPSRTLAYPSWNGKPIEQINPWGTIRTPTPSANASSANELQAAERAEIAVRAEPFLQTFEYSAPSTS